MATAMVWQSKATFTVIFLGLVVLAHADGGHSCAASPGSCPAELEPDRNIMMQTRIGIAMAEEKEGEGINAAEGRYEEGEKKAAVAMGEAVKEELGNLPMACEKFFENARGCDKPGDITTGVVRDSFKKCCVVGGHPESLCDSLSGEAFNEDDPKASVTNDHCNEMVRLRQAHDDWAHHKDSAQKIATVQLLGHANSDASHTAASLDDSLRRKKPACPSGVFYGYIGTPYGRWECTKDWSTVAEGGLVYKSYTHVPVNGVVGDAKNSCCRWSFLVMTSLPTYQCPPGSFPIKTKSACKDAARRLGLGRMNDGYMGNLCANTGRGRVWFTKMAATKANKWRLVCEFRW